MASKKKDARQAFEGKDVIATAIKVTNAGDGLSKAMSIDNEEFHIGQRVHIVLECEVDAVTHKTIKDTDGLVRVQTLKAGRATMVAADFVSEVLDAQDRKLEEAAGITRLFDENGDPIEPEPEPAAE
jgi:hypothetical protein